MSHSERTVESHEPLVGKDTKPLGGKTGSSGNRNGNTTTNYNNGNNSSSRHRSGSRGGGGGDDSEPQNLKNYYLETSYMNQHQALQRKLRKLTIHLYFLAGVVVVGFVILITLCAVFFAKLHHDMAHHTHKPTLSAQMAAILEEGVCVSCNDFRLGASAEEEDMLNKFIDESSGAGRSARCCADTGAELLELLKLVSTDLVQFNSS
ncbi:TNF ligand-like 2 [Elysia marginata]|uniref:TNF ligand-like 2 n=1 Tax=Elysia marginata TaxID=1093978 RepID=A0AAV4IRE0_9GAST|nr:TNF ligand-like 2 [Elysia marginata]